ncbi:MAG TPA: hypothetical protein VER17_04375 [Tepidisphaeraceae bacterium]|nr:hypothetical protein [Tepidisphaeraceae bacterium]
MKRPQRRGHQREDADGGGDLAVDAAGGDQQPLHAEREGHAEQQQEDRPAHHVVGQVLRRRVDARVARPGTGGVPHDHRGVAPGNDRGCGELRLRRRADLQRVDQRAAHARPPVVRLAQRVQPVEVPRRRQRQRVERAKLRDGVARSQLQRCPPGVARARGRHGAPAAHVGQQQAVADPAEAEDQRRARPGLDKAGHHAVGDDDVEPLRLGVAPCVQRDDLAEVLEESRVVQPDQRELLAREHDAAQRGQVLLEVRVELDGAELSAEVRAGGDLPAARLRPEGGDGDDLLLAKARHRLEQIRAVGVGGADLAPADAHGVGHRPGLRDARQVALGVRVGDEEPVARQVGHRAAGGGADDLPAELRPLPLQLRRAAKRGVGPGAEQQLAHGLELAEDRVGVEALRRVGRRVAAQAHVVQRHQCEPGHAPRLAQLRPDRHRRGPPGLGAARAGEGGEVDSPGDLAPPRRRRIVVQERALLAGEPVAVVLDLADVRGVLEVADEHRPDPHAPVGEVQGDQQLDQSAVVGAGGGIDVAADRAGEPFVKVDAVAQHPQAGLVLRRQRAGAREGADEVFPCRRVHLAGQVARALHERVAEPAEQALAIVQMLLALERLRVGRQAEVAADAEEDVLLQRRIGLDHAGDAVDGRAVPRGIELRRGLRDGRQAIDDGAGAGELTLDLPDLRPPVGGDVAEGHEQVPRRQHLHAVAAAEEEQHRARRRVGGKVAEQRQAARGLRRLAGAGGEVGDEGGRVVGDADDQRARGAAPHARAPAPAAAPAARGSICRDRRPRGTDQRVEVGRAAGLPIDGGPERHRVLDRAGAEVVGELAGRDVEPRQVGRGNQFVVAQVGVVGLVVPQDQHRAGAEGKGVGPRRPRRRLDYCDLPRQVARGDLLEAGVADVDAAAGDAVGGRGVDADAGGPEGVDLLSRPAAPPAPADPHQLRPAGDGHHHLELVAAEVDVGQLAKLPLDPLPGRLVAIGADDARRVGAELTQVGAESVAVAARCVGGAGGAGEQRAGGGQREENGPKMTPSARGNHVVLLTPSGASGIIRWRWRPGNCSEPPCLAAARELSRGRPVV